MTVAVLAVGVCDKAYPSQRGVVVSHIVNGKPSGPFHRSPHQTQQISSRVPTLHPLSVPFLSGWLWCTF